jgi:3-methylfumaryl-CoA hydratase
VTDAALDTVTSWSTQALHDLLDAPGPAPGEGEPVPPLWHWLAFRPTSAQSGLQHDGHVPIAAAMHLGASRRMFAGGRVEQLAPVTVGAPLERTTTSTAPVEKRGRSGSLVFVTVRHEITSDGRLCIVEEQDLAYRPPASPGTAERRAVVTDGPDRSPGHSWEHERTVVPDPRLLFRFSALTYNAHRIHYDLPYATETEGYPGLVVHGPLQVLLLLELVRIGPQSVTGVRFRGRAPAVAGERLTCRGRRSGDAVELEVVDPTGVVTMDATATLNES